MAMRPGDILREHSPDEYAKLVEIDRLVRSGQKAKPAKKKPRLWLKAHRLTVVALALVLVSVGAYGYASITILVPAIPARGILANCPNQEVPSNSKVVINQTGFTLVTCPNNRGLFEILAGTRAVANATLPSPYLDLYAYPEGQETIIATRCTDAAAAVNLAQPWTAGYRGNWSLCLDYGPAGPGGLPGFPITWTVS